ncbi:NYN domain-containing protein [Microcoleus sp. LEGE 07076]|uniref:NYN domain-containing protein n=1 Tax=Microcoleus sp. LEGE 07076 TaxID=915322 RepID=UPI00188166DC|nr:NYN domain-containing protein [Microcoleus sp. LEGE 07076]MBE9186069.1 NYN domain-containing protein [Microcoleus sp. LEGE 07076]
MTDNHRTSNQSTDQQQALVSIYWDYQNIPTITIAKDLLLFGSGFGYVVNRKVYDNWKQRNQAAQVTLRSQNFECFHVSQNIKNAVDFHLSADCFSEASNSPYRHTFIIVSGDGYGEVLIDKLHDKGKKVIILARKGNDNHNLKKLADQFYLIDELPKSIETYKLAA